MIKKILLAFFAAVALFTAMTGCHTVKGAGEDIESAGEAISGSSGK
jgi:predicted small secreted protein